MIDRMRLRAAVLAAKIAHRLTRLCGRGGGTAFPGLVAERIFPGTLAALTRGLARGSVAVTGTNGKTTTTRLLADIFAAAGWRYCHNRHGSNLRRGVAAAAAVQATAGGVLDADIGLWECDEAAFPAIAGEVRPRIIVITNLFRDQLDRYGETEAIRRRWQAVLPALGATTLVLNADDPSVASLGPGHAGPVLYFGLGDDSYRQPGRVHASDVRTCRLCNAPLAYAMNFLGHLGDWRCTGCGAARPPLAMRATHIRPSLRESAFILNSPAGARPVTMRLAGIYNIYNALAAATAAQALALDPDLVVRALTAAQPVFGRFERLAIAGRELCLFLVKNPTGANAVLQMLVAGGGRSLPVMIAINDLTADGHDVSWLWDADFELLRGVADPALTAGLRATDMAVRLNYAGVPAASISVEENLEKALFGLLRRAPEGATVYCLATYTAMLALQDMLARRGLKRPYWEE